MLDLWWEVVEAREVGARQLAQDGGADDVVHVGQPGDYLLDQGGLAHAADADQTDASEMRAHCPSSKRHASRIEQRWPFW